MGKEVMPPKALETTRVTKATSKREGNATVRTAKTETIQKRGDRVVRKTEGENTTKTELPETEKQRLARAPSKAKLTKTYYETLLRTLEDERRVLPQDHTAFNKKAAELYEALRGGINKAAGGIENVAWKQRLRDLVADTQRERAALQAMQLHGEKRQQRQKVYFERALDEAFALLASAVPLVGR